MPRVRYHGLTLPARKYQLSAPSREYLYTLVFLARVPAEQRLIIDYYHVKLDGTATGTQRVPQADHGYWLKRIQVERRQAGKADVTGQYTKLITQPTADVYARVLARG